MLRIERTSVLAVTILLLAAQTWGAGSLADPFKAGGDRLAATQNNDGGWDWPLSDGFPKFSNAPNVLASTGAGLVQAYQTTKDPNQLLAATKAGGYLLNKYLWPSHFTPEDGYFAVALDRVIGGTTYTDFMKKNFYDPLARGVFNYLSDGTLLVNTVQYVAIVQWQRAYQEVPNLAALDCGMGLYAAGVMGADIEPWLLGTKAMVDQLDGSQVYDVLGLAGAVFGLASVRASIDPASRDYACVSNLPNLAATLASYQLSTGGFTWNSLMKAEGVGNETVEETAMAIRALSKVDSQKYATNIKKAEAYLKSIQLPTGGWEDFIGAGECNEVTGQSLSALGAAQQVQLKTP
jgi:hypothetical protein